MNQLFQWISMSDHFITSGHISEWTVTANVSRRDVNNAWGACRADDDYATVRTTWAEVVPSDESCSDRLFNVTLKLIARWWVYIYPCFGKKKRKKKAPPLVVCWGSLWFDVHQSHSSTLPRERMAWSFSPLRLKRHAGRNGSRVGKRQQKNKKKVHFKLNHFCQKDERNSIY